MFGGVRMSCGDSSIGAGCLSSFGRSGVFGMDFGSSAGCWRGGGVDFACPTKARKFWTRFSRPRGCLPGGIGD